MANLDIPVRTVADVNKIMESMGNHERLAKGKKYAYWHGGDAASWKDGSMIYVYRLSDLTIREYLEDHNARVCKHINRNT